METTQRATGMSSFVEEVYAVPGGEGVALCIQCGTCTATCPSAGRGLSPRQIIGMVRAGMREEVLSGDSMWLCASCYLCTVRCPRNIKPTDLMHVLEGLAVRDGTSSNRTRTPLMYETFIDSVRNNGRVHEAGIMTRFYMRTSPLAALKMLPVGLALLSHGRMPLRAKKIEGRRAVRAILDRARALAGAQ
jgi:heterodisulfide reductase subunit C